MKRLSGFLFFITLLAVAVPWDPALAQDPPAPRSGAAISPDGVNIYAIMMGEDEPTLVFIHGWSCDGRYWRRQLEHFAPAHRVVAVDLAGHGASHRNREDFTIEAFGRDVAAVLEEFQLDDVILVGHSMGGPVMVEAALAAPGRVAGLIGVDNFQDVDRVVSHDEIGEMTAGLRKEFRRTTYRRVRGMFLADADTVLAHEVAVDMAMAPSIVALSALEATLEWNGGLAPGRLRELTVPLVSINSERYPTDAAAMEALVPDYRLWLMDGVGHFLMLEDPERFNAVLTEAVAYLTALHD